MRILIIIFCLTALGACKKARTCECKNSFNTYDAGEVKTTRSQAKKSCEALSTTDTECYLKD